VRDSKKTTEANRALVQSELFKFANEHSILFYSYGEATVEEINTLGMTKSHNLATERALNGLKAQRLKDPDLKPDYRIIIDGNKIDECLKTEPTTCIIQADDKSFTVASASILAKQFRDEQIKKLSQEFPQYHWDKNKGYGTADHRAALKKHGLTPHHRLKYCRNHL
jgi:ribonuclease HII